ncbi:MAG: hypothetical protein BWZ02_02222 [Lentisphaerae bacterium ADurb.BinA184]|nr:MAG: hypothetical protein BWZ02_02222 [Lentisphaerae bacterium ADurb.BinA184]
MCVKTQARFHALRSRPMGRRHSRPRAPTRERTHPRFHALDTRGPPPASKVGPSSPAPPQPLEFVETPAAAPLATTDLRFHALRSRPGEGTAIPSPPASVRENKSPFSRTHCDHPAWTASPQRAGDGCRKGTRTMGTARRSLACSRCLAGLGAGGKGMNLRPATARRGGPMRGRGTFNSQPARPPSRRRSPGSLPRPRQSRRRHGRRRCGTAHATRPGHCRRRQDPWPTRAGPDR